MDRRGFLKTSLTLAGAVALAGVACSDDDEGEAGGGGGGRPTLRVAGRAGPSAFPSPFSYFLAPGYNEMILIYDTLLWTDATGQLLPWLATEIPEPSPDGLTYTFELQDGVRWQDGRPLTVDDVVFTFEYFASQTLAPTVSVQPRNVARVVATGERTVEFTLDKPIIDFDRQVAAAVPIVPRHIWSEIPDAARVQDLETLVGSGPYRLESFSEAEGSSLYVANEEFFLGRPFVERVELVPVGSELDGLLAGDIDVGQPDPAGSGPAALVPFREDDRYEVLEGPAGSSFFFGLSWNVGGSGPPADVTFRRACAMAIDRDGLVERLLLGQGAPGNPGFFPPDDPFRAPVEQYELDLDGANRLLDEAGYARSGSGQRQTPEGQPLVVELLAPGGIAVTELVVRSLDEIGVRLDVQSVETIQVISRLNNGEYQMAIHPGGGLNGGPNFMRQNYSTRADTQLFFGAHGYSNPEFDDLADRQQVTRDEEERRDIVARMQEIVATDLPLLHLYYPTPFLIYRKGVLDAFTFPDPKYPVNAETASSSKQTYVTGSTTGVDIKPTG